MKQNVKKAILKILLLQIEFSKRDLSEAVEFISDKSENDVLSLFTKKNKQKESPSSEKGKAISEQTSKAVSNLKTEDFEKYQLLKMFDKHLRNSELLPRLDSIKKLGTSLSKDFEPGKSRKDTIPKIMALLAKLSIDDLKEIIPNILNESGHENSEYEDLANYIIHGHIATKDVFNK